MQSFEDKLIVQSIKSLGNRIPELEDMIFIAKFYWKSRYTKKWVSHA